MANNNTAIILGVGAGAALAIYFATKAQTTAQAAAVIAESQGAPPEGPIGLFDAISGNVSGVIKALSASAAVLENSIKERGPAHHASWKEAVKGKQKVYLVGSQCFATATGKSVACPSHLVAAAQLEGYFY